MSAMSRNKGARGEREVAELIELAKQNSVNIKVAHISALAQKKCHKIFTKII